MSSRRSCPKVARLNGSLFTVENILRGPTADNPLWAVWRKPAVAAPYDVFAVHSDPNESPVDRVGASPLGASASARTVLSSSCSDFRSASAAAVSQRAPSTASGSPALTHALCVANGCVYSSSQRSYMFAHVLTHTGERPFPCPFASCTYAGTQKQATESHYAAHHKDQPLAHPSARSELRRAIATLPAPKAEAMTDAGWAGPRISEAEAHARGYKRRRLSGTRGGSVKRQRIE
eukprot:c26252_g1_i1.p1 GENE.c26252_g1_i1~~c26252_g1_i1.p1  ORF type:complete len:234 (+),score=4.81 c26252_g1_i1:138-839(+)